MYLIDTNVILELLLDQEKAGEAEAFLGRFPLSDYYLTEFTLYSIGIVLLRRRMGNELVQFVRDFMGDGGVNLVRLEVSDIISLVQASQEYDLDFDDAYQYVVSGKYHLDLVSFDHDFDRTARGRKTPQEILAS